MAELKRSDIIEDSALEAPLILAKNLESAYEVIMKISKSAKEIGLPSGTMKELANETNTLVLEQKELEKVTKQIAVVTAKNNEEYIKEAKALKEVQTQLKNNIALGERDAKQITAKNASLKQLEAALAKNREAYKNMAGEEIRASAAGKELLKIIQQQDKSVKEINESTGKFTDNVGDYKKAAGAFQTIAPATGAAASGIMAMVRASLVFLATPIGLVIGALGAALFALKSYFAGSEEGQNRLNKIVAVGSAIFEQFMNVVEDIGEAIYNAFTNPKQALIDFGNFLKDQIINRFWGWLELIPALGKAVELLFKGQFKEAGKVAADAVGKVILGIENATDKVEAFIDDVGKAVDAGIEMGNRLADIQAQLDRDERTLIVNRAKTALEVSKLRAEALKHEGGERKQILLEAIALEEKLASQEIAIARLRLEQAELTAKANGADKDALKAIAEARAALYAAEASAFENTLRFKKEIAAIDEAEIKAAEERRKAQLKASEEYFAELLQMSKDAILKDAEQQQKGFDEEESAIKQKVINGIITREEGEKRLDAMYKKHLNERIDVQIEALEKELLLWGETAAEKEAIEKKLSELRKKREDNDFKNTAGGMAFLGEEAQKLGEGIEGFFAKWKENIFGALDQIGDIAGVMTQRTLANLDEESERQQEKTDELIENENEVTENRLKNANLTDEQRKAIEETSAERIATIEESNEKRQEQIEARRRKAIRKQAIVEKAIALAKATMNAAAAFAAMLTVGPAGFALAAFSAALAAGQIGIIAATPIPAAAKGITGHKGGPIIAGEKGQELVKMPGGRYALTSAVASVYDLPKGTDIIPHEETMRMLANASLHVDRRPLQGEPYSRIEKKLDRINSTIKNKREWNLTGRVTGYQDGGTRAKYIESLRNRPH